MNSELADLLTVLQLERLEINLFRGESRNIGSPQVFGGQVLGQALMAASATVEQRLIHSLHAYFLLPGDYNAPIIYEVERSRDGASFSSRRVLAIQHGQQIFHMSASFQLEQPGLDHQIPMPSVPPPEQLLDVRTLVNRAGGSLPDKVRQMFAAERPIEFRPVRPDLLIGTTPSEPMTQFWFRAVDALPDGEVTHRGLLAYASDFHLLRTATLPHGIPFPSPDLRMATIDHAMWFHRPVRMDDWLLYSLDSPSASGSRGLSRGSIFDRSGRLVASVAQEGLVRLKRS